MSQQTARNARASVERTARQSQEKLGSTGMVARRQNRRSQEGMGPGRPGGKIRARGRASKEFVVNEKWAPPRRPTTVELGTARKTFFELDRDGSGCIDTDELRVMMKSLGQDPSDKELKELVDSVDENGDGQIQLREFIKLFCQASDNKSATSPLQVNDCFSAFGGDPRDDMSSVTTDQLCAKMLEQFDLEVDCKVFGKADNESGITKHDFERLLQPTKTPVDDGKRISSRRGGVQLPPPPPLGL